MEMHCLITRLLDEIGIIKSIFFNYDDYNGLAVDLNKIKNEYADYLFVDEDIDIGFSDVVKYHRPWMTKRLEIIKRNKGFVPLADVNIV